MNQNEIIEMAEEAGMVVVNDKFSLLPFLEAFAKLVEDKVRQEIVEKNAPVIKKVNEHIKELQDAVKAEREACAKVCEDREEAWRKAGFWGNHHEFREMAFAIRARGNA